MNTPPNNPGKDHGDRVPPGRTLLRGFLGGILMGLANLVPGVSGGTMLVATGVYGHFVHAVARITTFRFKSGPLLMLGIISLSALLTILFGAGTMKNLVQDHRWVMYSLFIGFTLGGVPLLWSMVRPMQTSAMLGMLSGIIAMAALAMLENSTDGPITNSGGTALLVLAGIAAGSAMVLPGISGSYLLLILGQYVAILGAINAVLDGELESALGVLLPVGIGVIIGIVIISNIVSKLLKVARNATLGVLLGLLIGAVFGLWPFRSPIPPQVGDVIRGQLMETQEQVAAIDSDHWNLATFAPTIPVVLAALGLLLAGFIVSVAITRLGRNEQP